MSKTSPRVFLSYGKENENEAFMLYKQLISYGAEVWFDKESLLGGQNWKSEIATAIETSRYFLVLLSTKSVTRKGYLNREITYALEILSEFPGNETFIIPARLDECHPSHKALNDLHWINLFPDWDKGLFEILRALGLSDTSSKKSPLDISICAECGANDFVFYRYRSLGIPMDWVLRCNRCNWTAYIGDPDNETLEKLKEKYPSPYGETT